MKVLYEGAKALGLTLTKQELDAFQVYQRELAEWNQRFNLTAISDENQVQLRHFLDSLSCLLALNGGRLATPARVDGGRRIGGTVRQMASKAIDVGTGPGFPGIPLKIVCPRLKLTLLEATGKKVTFLQHMVDVLNMKDVQIVHERAEQAGQSAAHREGYDLVLARAVADLSILAEYTLPLCRMGGQVIAQKGQDVQAEVMAAEHAITLLGGKLRHMIEVELAGLAESRNLVVIDKVARTPGNYPRRPGIPNKTPL